MYRTRLLLLLLTLLTGAAAPVNAWDWLWAHQFGSSVFITAYGGATDGSGVYVAGAVFGEVPGASPIGFVDGYVRKLDHAGGVLWTRRVGTSAYDDAGGVVVDADGVYISGITCGALAGQTYAGRCDVFVAKLTAGGDLVWATQFGTPAFESPYQYGPIAVHASGVYVAGKTEGTFPGATPAGGPNTFLARVDRTTGGVIWIRQFGTPDHLWFGAGGVGVDDTGVAVSANSGDPNTFRYDGEVRKYGIDGTLQWSKVFDQSAAPCGHPIFGLASHRGHVYVIGQTYEWALTDCEVQPYGQSHVIGLLQHFDASGNPVWQRRIKAGLPGRDGGAGIGPFTGAKVVHVTDAGIFVGANVRKLRFAGDVRREPPSDRSECHDPGAAENVVWKTFDGYVRRYDHDGHVIWTHQFGSGLYELVSSLGSDGSAVYASGFTRCVIEDGTESENGTPVDGFLVRFAIDPTTLSGRVQLIVGQIETLSDAGRIASGDFNTLVSHLESALSALDRSQSAVARNTLHAFVKLVENYAANDRLTMAEADGLISAASAIAGEL